MLNYMLTILFDYLLKLFKCKRTNYMITNNYMKTKNGFKESIGKDFISVIFIFIYHCRDLCQNIQVLIADLQVY